MSEEQIAVLRADIRRLNARTNRRHQENQAQAEARQLAFQAALETQQRTFSQAMNNQRELMQEALNKQFLEHVNLKSDVKSVDEKLCLAIGTGQPGEGRLGLLEESMETMKKFRWQALAVVSLLMFVLEFFNHH